MSDIAENGTVYAGIGISLDGDPNIYVMNLAEEEGEVDYSVTEEELTAILPDVVNLIVANRKKEEES